VRQCTVTSTEKPSQRTIEWEVNAVKPFLRWASENASYRGNALTFGYTLEKEQARSAFTSDPCKKLTDFM